MLYGIWFNFENKKQVKMVKDYIKKGWIEVDLDSSGVRSCKIDNEEYCQLNLAGAKAEKFTDLYNRRFFYNKWNKSRIKLGLEKFKAAKKKTELDKLGFLGRKTA